MRRRLQHITLDRTLFLCLIKCLHVSRSLCIWLHNVIQRFDFLLLKYTSKWQNWASIPAGVKILYYITVNTMSSSSFFMLTQSWSGLCSAGGFFPCMHQVAIFVNQTKTSWVERSNRGWVGKDVTVQFRCNFCGKFALRLSRAQTTIIQWMTHDRWHMSAISSLDPTIQSSKNKGFSQIRKRLAFCEVFGFLFIYASCCVHDQCCCVIIGQTLPVNFAIWST